MIALSKKAKFPNNANTDNVAECLDGLFDSLDKFFFDHEVDYRYIDRRDFEDILERCLTDDEWEGIKHQIREPLAHFSEAIDNAMVDILVSNGLLDPESVNVGLEHTSVAQPSTSTSETSWHYSPEEVWGTGTGFQPSTASTGSWGITNHSSPMLPTTVMNSVQQLVDDISNVVVGGTSVPPPEEQEDPVEGPSDE
jgi:hypothetical protein